MKRWFSGIGKGLGSLFTQDDDPEVSFREHRERVVSLGLRRLHGEAPDQKAVADVLAKQAEIDALHHRLKEGEGKSGLADEIQFDGLSRLKPVQEAGGGYLLVFVQGFLSGILQELAQQPKPMVSVVFRLHEDASAHVPVLERGHGLAFELPFFPAEGPAQLSDFLGELTAVSSKGAAFAVETGVPVLPVWCRMDAEGLTLEIAPPMEGHASVEALTTNLATHFARRLKASPAEMDWEADCWYPPANRLLPSRFPWRVALSEGASLDGLAPFRVLVRVPDEVREACLAVPAVRALKRGRPDVHLTVLVGTAMVSFWELLDACDAVVPVGGKEGADGFRLGVVMSREKGALDDLKGFAVERTVGMENHPVSEAFDDVLNMPRKLGPPEHRHRTYLRIAHRLGAEVVNDLALRGPMRKLEGSAMVIGVAPESDDGSSYVWDAERFRSVVRDGPERVVWRVFVDADSEEDWVPLVNELGEDRVVLSTVLSSVASRLEALEECAVLLSNDNEWLHLAATVYAMPTIAIYGPSEPIETAPLSAGALTLRRHVECTPCFLKECPIDHRCLNEIEVDEVLGALKSILER